MSLIKHALVVGGTVLVIAFIVTLGLATACDSEPSTSRVRTPTWQVTGVATVIESTGELELQTRETTPGETVQVTGTGWNGIGPVKFYLLTEEQFATPQLRTGAVTLGERTAAEDGSLSFEFILAERYQTPDGRLLIISPGQKLYISARQGTEGGAHGTTRGPLIVSSDERG